MRNSNKRGIIGWDIGGAHVKLAQLSFAGKLQRVEQHPCALWKGLDQLDQLLKNLNTRLRFADIQHAITMTGELVDLFPDRRAGVRAILATLNRHVQAASLRVFTLDEQLRELNYARRHPDQVASANWCATAMAIAERIPNAVLIDIGSTTTDLIPIRNGHVMTRGRNDAERLRENELVYSGVVRTPIMALSERLKFAGRPQRIAAEWFATTGDAYVLLGKLPRTLYQSPTADGAGVSKLKCARRLARMLGMDVHDAALSQWKKVGREIAAIQSRQIRGAVESILSRQRRKVRPTIVGAGCGRFIAEDLAHQLHLRYVSFDKVLGVPNRLSNIASVCATAVAVAQLAVCQ